MIEVNDVSFTYPTGVQALNKINLLIEDNDFVAIMGENGAGKTTLIKHFNGILRPQHGDVIIDGINSKKASVAELSRNVGLVFQNPDHQLFSETVSEEIAFGLKNFGYPESEIDHKINSVLQLLDLSKYKDTSPFLLSGGERKRVALASVLAWDPQILVLDEPTIGQDHYQKEKLRHFISDLHDQGRTIIIVTHDVEFVADCSPRILLMSQSQIISDGNAKRILTDSELTQKASIILPQIAELFRVLSPLGLPHQVLNVPEAQQILGQVLKS